MKKEFWLEKWQKNQTGFHKNNTHPFLENYVNHLGLKQGDCVFVPLCGKSVDMLWLNQQGYHVIGIELSQLAIEQFFAENNLIYTLHKAGEFAIYKHENITLYQGDFFALTQQHLNAVKAVYDRAALIALPDDLVGKYVNAMKQIIPSGAKELLITLEFVKKIGPIGPPFTTTDRKVSRLFSSYKSVSLLQEQDIISSEAKFKELGAQYVYERAYVITF